MYKWIADQKYDKNFHWQGSTIQTLFPSIHLHMIWPWKSTVHHIGNILVQRADIHYIMFLNRTTMQELYTNTKAA